jgi:hypothetical protein
MFLAVFAESTRHSAEGVEERICSIMVIADKAAKRMGAGK